MSCNVTSLDTARGWSKQIPNPCCLCCGLTGLVRAQADIILDLCLMQDTFESLHIPQQWYLQYYVASVLYFDRCEHILNLMLVSL